MSRPSRPINRLARMRRPADVWSEFDGFLYLGDRLLGKVPELVGFGETPLRDVVAKAREGDGIADMALRWHVILFLERLAAQMREETQ